MAGRLGAAVALLAASFGLSYWLSANAYRLMQYTRHVRGLIVWLNLATSAALFFLLAPYWAPMWLLFLTAPAASGMFMRRWQVLGVALASSAAMFAVYFYRALEMAAETGVVFSAQLAGMAATQAVFIVFFSQFVAAMAETAVKVRDSLR